MAGCCGFHSIPLSFSCNGACLLHSIGCLWEVYMLFIAKFSRIVNKYFLITGGISVLTLMTLATANVVMRIFHIPFRGSYELVSFLGALVIAFALGYTQQKKMHIVVEILTDKFPKRIQRALDVANSAITMVFFAIVAWQVYRWGMKISETGELSETLKIIYHPFIFCVSLGFASLSVTLFVDFLKAVLGREDI